MVSISAKEWDTWRSVETPLFDDGSKVTDEFTF
jgi:hypothetical protein